MEREEEERIYVMKVRRESKIEL